MTVRAIELKVRGSKPFRLAGEDLRIHVSSETGNLHVSVLRDGRRCDVGVYAQWYGWTEIESVETTKGL